MQTPPFRSSAPDRWVSPRPRPGAAARHLAHGPIQPMFEDRHPLRSVLIWSFGPVLACIGLAAWWLA